MQLAEKVSIVTGGGSGIGKACALLFAAEGAKVIVADWNAETGAGTVEEIRAAGGESVFCHADVSKSPDVERLIQTAEATYGRLDVLLNNAAVQVLGKLAETTEEEWDLMQSVNLKGVFLCTKYAIPTMIRAGGGSIINMASILGFVADADLAAYGAMKGGVVTMTKATALGYGPDGIRVNCICPGDVDTAMVQDYFNKEPDPEEARRRVSREYALRRIATPREIAQTAVFLASDASSFTTGAVMVVDGGVTSKCY
jgi:NAD(P)-dependent dehydrogenase (short-subunit alcohol dehydrogenase family)